MNKLLDLLNSNSQDKEEELSIPFPIEPTVGELPMKDTDETGIKSLESLNNVKSNVEEIERVLPNMSQEDNYREEENDPNDRLSRYQKLLAEHNKTRENNNKRMEDIQNRIQTTSQQDLEESQRLRNIDNWSRVGGGLVDALTKFGNANAAQKAAIPGVQIEGSNTSKAIADMNLTKGQKEDSKARMEALLSELKTVQDNARSTMDPFALEKLRLAEERLGLAMVKESNLGDRHKDKHGLQTDKFTHAKIQKDELSEKQIESLEGYDQTLNSLHRIYNTKMKDDIKTGPLADLRNYAAKKIGIDDPKVSALRAELVDVLAERIKTLSGLAVTDKEFERLQVTLPGLGDKPETFEKLYKDAVKRIEEAKMIREAHIYAGGKDVGSYNQRMEEALNKMPKEMKDKMNVNNIIPRDNMNQDSVKKTKTVRRKSDGVTKEISIDKINKLDKEKYEILD